MVGIESREDAANALTYAKDTLGIDPEMIVMDLSSKLISAASDVYGYEKIALDPFHVMQCLNRAILKDLSRFRTQNFGLEKKQLSYLYSLILPIQRQGQEKGVVLDQIKHIPNSSTSALVESCRKVVADALPLVLHTDPDHFFTALKQTLPALIDHPSLPIKSFGMSVAEKCPRKAATPQAMGRVKAELLKKLKTLCRECQRPLNDEQRHFSKMKWLLMKQPERLTSKQASVVARFLDKYPKLNAYRDLTLSIGSVYRLPIALVNPKLIEDCPINPEWGSELQACLGTLKKHVDPMFRFKSFYEKYPDAPKKCRANMEYQNTKFHHLFGVGNYMRGMNRIGLELQQHLGGVVRNFLS